VEVAVDAMSAAPARRKSGGPLPLSRAETCVPAARVSVVVPVHNARRYLPHTLPALRAALGRTDGAELVFVDNGSTDGSFEFLSSFADGRLRVNRLRHGTIAAVRNHGARLARGEYLGFVDADCVVPEDYLERALETLRTTGAAATGCEVEIPAAAHWIEATWHQLHYVGRDRFVHYLNSANFFVSRDAFERAGGFDDALRTGEDAEIGQRIRDAGFTIYESTRVAAVHLGNPKSIPQFYRRTVWHALGMLATVRGGEIDRPVAMTAAHLVMSVVGPLLAVWSGLPPAAALVVALACQIAAPLATVGYRCRQTRRLGRLGASTLLYWLYYCARAQALAMILTGHDRRYRK
jgi:hypothetical protein